VAVLTRLSPPFTSCSEHQKEHWPVHKRVCGKAFGATVEEKASTRSRL
jgi:hypothetical protein